MLTKKNDRINPTNRHYPAPGDGVSKPVRPALPKPKNLIIFSTLVEMGSKKETPTLLPYSAGYL
jgi:hypothetical protein